MEGRVLEEDNASHELNGTIVRRRCFGKNLAFADILSSTIDGETWKITFQRSAMEEPNQFPTKNSALPFGAKIKAEIFRIQGDWLVKSWSLTTDPRREAIDVATLSGGGISSSEYSRSRHNSHFQAKSLEKRETAPHRPLDSSCSPVDRQNQRETHPSSNGKAYKAFAVWLKGNLLSHDSQNLILDVGGGKGRLSLELASLAEVKCTIIDPVQRKRPKVKHLIKQGKPVPDFVASYFASAHHEGLPAGNDWVKTSIPYIESHSCLVGLHPDQCTEDIVEAALRHEKPFAVVPCCVYPDLFSKRKLRNGRQVRSYEDFIAYLTEKDDRIQQATLPFNGKNICVFCTGDISTKDTLQS